MTEGKAKRRLSLRQLCRPGLFAAPDCETGSLLSYAQSIPLSILLTRALSLGSSGLR